MRSRILEGRSLEMSNAIVGARLLDRLKLDAVKIKASMPGSGISFSFSSLWSFLWDDQIGQLGSKG